MAEEEEEEELVLEVVWIPHISNLDECLSRPPSTSVAFSLCQGEAFFVSPRIGESSKETGFFACAWSPNGMNSQLYPC